MGLIVLGIMFFVTGLILAHATIVMEEFNQMFDKWEDK